MIHDPAMRVREEFIHQHKLNSNKKNIYIVSTSFLFLVVRPLLLVVRPGAPSRLPA